MSAPLPAVTSPAPSGACWCEQVSADVERIAVLLGWTSRHIGEEIAGSDQTAAHAAAGWLREAHLRAEGARALLPGVCVNPKRAVTVPQIAVGIVLPLAGSALLLTVSGPLAALGAAVLALSVLTQITAMPVAVRRDLARWRRNRIRAAALAAEVAGRHAVLAAARSPLARVRATMATATAILDEVTERLEAFWLIDFNASGGPDTPGWKARRALVIDLPLAVGHATRQLAAYEARFAIAAGHHRLPDGPAGGV